MSPAPGGSARQVAGRRLPTVDASCEADVEDIWSRTLSGDHVVESTSLGGARPARKILPYEMPGPFPGW
jgi:hypothetical protein